ncbi:ribonuclease H-like domain-containing protein [Tanacetum coccineum]
MTPFSPPSYQFLKQNIDPSPTQLKLLSTPDISHPHEPAAQSTTNISTQHIDIAQQPTTPPSGPSQPITPPNQSNPPSLTQPTQQNHQAQPNLQQTTATGLNSNMPSRHPMVTRSRDGTTKPVDRLNLHVATLAPIPKTHVQASHNPHWQNAMQGEFNALIKNGTWVLVPRPPNVNVVRSMWLFKHKFHADGSLSRYKARLVANGKSQQQGIDYDETFSPVLDVKNAFLHGHLTETVYMHQPPGFTDSAHPDYVCLLQKSLYGLKQAPRAWFQRFASYALRVGFQHSKTDSSLFIYHRGVDTAYLLLYVDDIILTASSSGLLQRIISSLKGEFAMTDLGPLNYFLGISATCTSSGIFLSQTPVDTEKKLGPEGALVDDPTLYRSLAEGLQYLTFTRPDLSYVIQQLCLYMHDPREPHLNVMKHVLCYIYIGDNLLAWSSKRQETLSRSSVEAEYRGVANAIAKTSWLHNLLCELHAPLYTATMVFCDNFSVVYMSANPVQHQRTKYIEIDIHFVWEKVITGHVRVLHVPSWFQYAYIFTKGLPYTLFADF